MLIHFGKLGHVQIASNLTVGLLHYPKKHFSKVMIVKYSNKLYHYQLT